MAKKTFFVREPLRHNGDDFAVGAEITLEAKEATGLLASGVLSADAPAVAVAAEEVQPVIDAESPAK